MKHHSTEHLKYITSMVTSVLVNHDRMIDNSKTKAQLKVNPIVQGSMGLLLHGVDYSPEDSPDDIDILVSNGLLAHELMMGLAKELEIQKAPYQIKYTLKGAGPRLIYDYTFVDTTEINPELKVQLIGKESFGMEFVDSIQKEGIPVLPPKEAIQSLIIRITAQGMRTKDNYAYYTLLEKYGRELMNDGEYKASGKAETLKSYFSLPDQERLALKFNMPPTAVQPTPAIKEETQFEQRPVFNRPASTAIGASFNRSRQPTVTSRTTADRETHSVTTAGMFKPVQQPVKMDRAANSSVALHSREEQSATLLA